MDLVALRRYCAAKRAAVAEHPFGPGALVMKVGGKIFAIIGEDADPVTVSLKCEPELAIALRKAHDAVSPGYHLDKRHWNTVTLDGTVTDAEVREWIDDSYDLVVEGLSRRVRESIENG
ncbi:MAG: MmcQ/YjbR family DNA-binding protein [Actinobacteria bacterium]|nr:MmcQ/YjbR family DNA-binding protein [Actinomycetota bacterium]